MEPVRKGFDIIKKNLEGSISQKDAEIGTLLGVKDNLKKLLDDKDTLLIKVLSCIARFGDSFKPLINEVEKMIQENKAILHQLEPQQPEPQQPEPQQHEPQQPKPQQPVPQQPELSPAAMLKNDILALKEQDDKKFLEIEKLMNLILGLERHVEEHSRKIIKVSDSTSEAITILKEAFQTLQQYKTLMQ